jgi:hypothetical protein
MYMFCGESAADEPSLSLGMRSRVCMPSTRIRRDGEGLGRSRRQRMPRYPT